MFKLCSQTVLLTYKPTSLFFILPFLGVSCYLQLLSALHCILLFFKVLFIYHLRERVSEWEHWGRGRRESPADSALSMEQGSISPP